MPTEVTKPPVQLLRESLRADSPVREASVARMMSVCASIGIPFIFALGSAQGSFSLALGINGFLLAVIIYYQALLRALKVGWFHPAVCWANVFLETSVPAAIILMAVKIRGPEYAIMSPAQLIWGGVLVVSSLRAWPLLSLVAGGLAAIEWLAMYFVLFLPQLGTEPPAQLRPAGVALRAVCLLFCSAFGALCARHFVRKAEEALSTVRERDLMGKYFLHERIGAGGMAEVYRATYCPEGGFQKPVAIKRVLPLYARSTAFTEMFREEARLCAMLAHPNIVQVFDCGAYNDTFMLAMEYVDGLPLNRLLKRLKRPLPLSAVSYMGAELAKALDYIHKKVGPDGVPLNLVHRDVNPPNILISRIGEVKLGDFGVANAATRVETGRSDVFYGKLHYAAPEQLITAPFDGRADLFALGLTLNEALTAKKVYGSESDSALNQGIFPRIPRPSELRPDVPADLDELVMGLCEIDRERRPATGQETFTRMTALVGPASPFPSGQQELARAVEEALYALPPPAPAADEPSERATEVQGGKGEKRARKVTSSAGGSRPGTKKGTGSHPSAPGRKSQPQPAQVQALRKSQPVPEASVRKSQPQPAPEDSARTSPSLPPPQAPDATQEMDTEVAERAIARALNQK